MVETGGTLTGGATFYRSGKRWRPVLDQSAKPPTVLHRILPDLLTGQDQRPLQLRPARPSRGDARPWSRGAAGPGAARPLAARRPDVYLRVRRRGVRAGRRVQLRRHREDGDEDRACSDRPTRARVLVPIPAAGCASDCAPVPVLVTDRRPARGAGRGAAATSGSVGWDSAGRAVRCLARPPRLSQRRTGRLAAVDGATSETGGATRGLLKIGHLNIQSIANKLDDITILLRDQQLDIFCLTETWLSPQISDQFLAFPGYCILRQDREGRRGGGVAILHRSEVRAQRLLMPAGGPLETLWASVSWPGGRSATVGVIYRPPDAPVTSSLENMRELLMAARCHGQPIYLLGDINLNVLDTQSTQVRRYCSMVGELGMAQLVSQPTHLHPVPAALDHVLTDQLDPAPAVSVLPDAISDHQPVIVAARLGRVRRPPEWRTARPWRRCDWDAVSLALLEADWSRVDDATDVNDCVREFMSIWNSTLDIHCPERRVRVRGPDCPWLADDPALRALMSERDAARDTWLCLRTPEAKADFTQLKNAVKSQLIRARRDFLCGDLTSGSRGDFWPKFKRLSAAGQRRPASAAKTAGEEETASWADELNRHFSTVGSRVAEELREAVADGGLGPRPPTVCSARFRLRPATLPELSRCIQRMSASRAVGFDGVPLFAVRRCFPVIGPHLLRLVNLSMRTGVFPECWKLACVVPLPKSGDLTNPCNHRPISLLSVLSKVLEKVVCVQLTDYLESHKLLSSCQYAYRSHHSTEDAVLDAVERLVNNTDRGLISTLTAIDLSKAFDSVDHGILLTKLPWYGIDDVTWFRSYLSDRRQIVRGGRTTLPVTCGVPQGSIIGPIIFILMTSDLPAHLTHGTLISYADDTLHIDSSFPTASSLTELQIRLELTMRELNAWFTSNSLKMNSNKTDFLVVGSKQNITKTQNFSFTADDISIQPSKTVTFLGVVIDPVLSWELHISHVVRKCNKILFSLYRFRHYFTSGVLRTLVEAYVFPHIVYCICVWGGASKGLIHAIQKLINFSARIVTGVKKHQRITPSLNSLDWPKIDALVARRDVTKVWRLLRTDGVPPNVRSLLVPRSAVSARETRGSDGGALNLQRCRLSSSQKAFSYRGAAAWNALPQHVRDAPTLSAFKAAISRN